MRCLVIGASGQLGRAVCDALRLKHEVLETAHRAPRPDQWRIDLADAGSVRLVLVEVKPEWIVIAGALGNVDRAEQEPELCRAINVNGPRVVAEYAQEQGSRVVYYSSDAVFDGSQNAYEETDRVSPLNTYARSKVEAERLLQELLPEQSLIIRTAWMYGPDERRRNFVLNTIEELRHGRMVQVPSDQWGSPTYTEDVAWLTRALLEQGASGVFHAVGPEFLSRDAWAQRICRQFQLDEALLHPTSLAQLQQAAVRPARVLLDCRKVQALGARPFRTPAEGLALLKAWDRELVAQ